jgi:hypothetical protein
MSSRDLSASFVLMADSRERLQRWNHQIRRVSIAIHARYAPAVLEKLLPNGEWSRRIMADMLLVAAFKVGNPIEEVVLMKAHGFTRGPRILLLAWVSCVSQLAFYAL